MTFKDKLFLYLQNKSNSMDDEYNDYLHYLRFHNVDEVDHLEAVIRKVRRDTFSEIRKDIFALLSLADKGQLEELQGAVKVAKSR